MMNANYEYIISSLPDITLDWKYGEGGSFDSYVQWIKSQLSPADCKSVDILLDGFKDTSLVKEFYQKAVSDKCRFIREYFAFDLNVRNGKARFLNRAFGRPENQDTIQIEELQDKEFAESAKLDAALASEDLLTRERALDNLMWEKIGEITTFDYFDIDAVLAFISRLHIIDRWLSLDDAAGREMFRKLVDEVRETFTGVHYVAPADD